MTETVFEAVVPDALVGERVDRAVALLTGLARREVTELVRAGRVRVDGEPVSVRSRALGPNQRLRVDLAAASRVGPAADPAVVFAVVHEDRHLVVVDKPAGLVVHHGPGHGGHTLVDGLLARYPDLAELAADNTGDPSRPGIVHRLDKGTSGLLAVARTPSAYASLTAQMRAHSAGREYRALVVGAVEAEAGVVDAPVGRSARQPTRMAVTATGRPARTAYRVLERYASPAPATLIEAVLETGRTHQVRVHLAAIGHPVVGDDRYGRGAARPPALTAGLGAGRLFLHAARLSLDHPATGARLVFEAPLPADLEAVLRSLGP